MLCMNTSIPVQSYRCRCKDLRGELWISTNNILCGTETGLKIWCAKRPLLPRILIMNTNAHDHQRTIHQEILIQDLDFNIALCCMQIIRSNLQVCT